MSGTPTLAAAALQAATDAVVDLLDVGAGSNGTLEILDDTTVLSIHALTEPAFGDAAVTGIATAAAIADEDAALADGTADVWKLKDEDDNVIISGVVGQKRAIAAVGTGAGGTVSTAGDHTTEFAVGAQFRISGSTGNDGIYTVQSRVYSAPNTVITVQSDETIASATVDGYVYVGQIGLNNTSILTGQVVSVSGFTYRAVKS